jgi:hypothetical protein
VNWSLVQDDLPPSSKDFRRQANASSKRAAAPEFNPERLSVHGRGGIGSYVAAWHLSRVIALHRNTWEAVASHRATPYFNWRYCIVLNNELVASGVIPRSRLPVPPRRRASLGPTRPGSPAGPSANQGAVVLDQADAMPRFAGAGSVRKLGLDRPRADPWRHKVSRRS